MLRSRREFVTPDNAFAEVRDWLATANPSGCFDGRRDGRIPSMMASIDRAGRVVIPKEIRDRLSLEADAALDVTIDGDSIRLAPVRKRSWAIVSVDGWPVIERVDAMTTTEADVQRWRDADQR